MLKIQFKDNRQQAFWVMEQSFSIGSGKDNNLVIDDPSVSASHARLVHQGDNFFLKAIGKSEIEVNGQAITKSNITCGDEIKIGAVNLDIVDPLAHTPSSTPQWSLIAYSSWLSGQEFPLNGPAGNSITLGRGSDCDVVFTGTHLSRRHAKITISHDVLDVIDLDSVNGTYVNGDRVKESRLKPGDQLRLDTYSFCVFGPGIQLPPATTASHRIIEQNPHAGKKAPSNPKAWKTRSTSPGNREETAHAGNKLFTQISAVIIILLFFFALYRVAGF